MENTITTQFETEQIAQGNTCGDAPRKTEPAPPQTAVSYDPGANGYALALSPSTAEQAMRCAAWLAKSGMVPAAYRDKPNDIVVAAAMGARVGLDTLASLASIAVIHGMPTIWGDAMPAICQARPDWAGLTVEWSGEEGSDEWACTVTAHRRHCPPYTGRFSVADAKKAGLWNKKGSWTTSPRRMLEVRARSFALRGQFADALAGFACREEMEDIDRPSRPSSRSAGNDLPELGGSK